MVTLITPATDDEIAEWKVGLADLAKRYTLRGSEVDCVRLIARIETEKAAKEELAAFIQLWLTRDNVSLAERRSVILNHPAMHAALTKHKETT